MGVFLFCIANFSNGGVWLILEIICLGDLFTERGEWMMCARAWHKLMAKVTDLHIFPVYKLKSCSLYLPSNI